MSDTPLLVRRLVHAESDDAIARAGRRGSKHGPAFGGSSGSGCGGIDTTARTLRVECHPDHPCCRRFPAVACDGTNRRTLVATPPHGGDCEAHLPLRHRAATLPGGRRGTATLSAGCAVASAQNHVSSQIGNAVHGGSLLLQCNTMQHNRIPHGISHGVTQTPGVLRTSIHRPLTTHHDHAAKAEKIRSRKIRSRTIRSRTIRSRTSGQNIRPIKKKSELLPANSGEESRQRIRTSRSNC